MADAPKASTQACEGRGPEAEARASAGLTGLLVMAAVVSAISALLYGYDTGIISGALLQIRREYHPGTGWSR